MQYNNLVIINNEKISKDQENYYCDNVDVKSIPEGLSQYNHIHYISRKLKKGGN